MGDPGPVIIPGLAVTSQSGPGPIDQLLKRRSPLIVERLHRPYR